MEQQKLTASDGAVSDSFGHPVFVDMDLAIIGAGYNDDAGSNSGSAYVFRFNGTSWVEEQKLTASDAAAGDLFGLAVSASSDVVVIGASGNDDAGTVSGSAYLFRFNGSGWVEEQKLTASDAAARDVFGFSVSASGDVVLVGANRDDSTPGGSDSGSSYVFRFDGVSWIEEQKLTASDATPSDLFGSSVFIRGDAAVIGASFSGVSYVFGFNGTDWVEEQILNSSDQTLLGSEVATDGNTVLDGTPYTSGAGQQSGAVYVFEDLCLNLGSSGCPAIRSVGLVGADPGPIPTPGTAKISWYVISAVPPASYTFWYSADGGTTWRHIEAGVAVSGPPYEYSWAIPPISTARVRVRVDAFDAGGQLIGSDDSNVAGVLYNAHGVGLEFVPSDPSDCQIPAPSGYSEPAMVLKWDHVVFPEPHHYDVSIVRVWGSACGPQPATTIDLVADFDAGLGHARDYVEIRDATWRDMDVARWSAGNSGTGQSGGCCRVTLDRKLHQVSDRRSRSL